MSLKLFREYYDSVINDVSHKEFYSKYPLNEFWANSNMEEMKNLINNSLNLIDLIHGADKTFMFSVNEGSYSNILAVDWLCQNLFENYNIDLNNLAVNISESIYSYPKNSVLKNGRLLSPDFLRCLNICYQINQTFQFKNNEISVLEIGAGTGHLARLMNIMFNVKTYVIIDIPETLAFSYSFLKLEFPDVDIHLYSPISSSYKDLQKSKVILVPANYAEKFPIKDFDIFLNTASLGEMRHESVKLWMNLFQSIFNVRSFYTLNRFLNTIRLPEHSWRLYENQCAQYYDKKWNIRKWELEPKFTRCPYIDTQIARYVEIIGDVYEPINFESQNVIDNTKKEIEAQDWYRFFDKDKAMIALDSTTSHDYTLNGTLFKLWNGLRLTELNDKWFLNTMVMYLSFINKSEKHIYEEYYFYLGKIINININGENNSSVLTKISKGYIFYNLIKKSINKFLIQFIYDNNNIILNKINPPKLIGRKDNFNIVYYDKYFYYLMDSQGPIDLELVPAKDLTKLIRLSSFIP